MATGDLQVVNSGAHTLDHKFNAFFPPDMEDYAIPGHIRASAVLEALKKRDRWIFVLDQGIAFLSSLDFATYMILNHRHITHERALDLRNYSGRNGAFAVRHNTKLRKIFRLLSRPNICQIVVLLPNMEPTDQLSTWVRNVVNRKTFLPFLNHRANEFEPQLSRTISEAGCGNHHLVRAHDTAMAMKALNRLVVEREDFVAVVDPNGDYLGMVTTHFIAHEYIARGLEGVTMADLLKKSDAYLKEASPTISLIGEDTTPIKQVLAQMLACKKEKFMVCEAGSKKPKFVVRLADIYFYLSNVPRAHAAKANKELKQLQKQNKRYASMFEDDWQGSVSLERVPLNAFEPDASAWTVFLYMRNSGYTTCLISKPFRHKHEQVLSQVGIPYHGLITYHDLVVKLIKYYVQKNGDVTDSKMQQHFKSMAVLDVLNYSGLNACIPIPYKDSRVIDVMSLLGKSDVQQIILTMDTIPKSSTTIVVDTLGPKFALEYLSSLNKTFPSILLRPATDLVTSKAIPTIHEDKTVLEGFNELIKQGLVNIGVVDSKGRLVGNFTTKLFFYMSDDTGFELAILKQTINEFLTSITKRKHVDWQGHSIPPILARVNENVTIQHVIQSLLRNGTSVSYLVDLENQPVAQITKQDVFAYFCDTKPNLGIPDREKVKHPHVKSLKKRFQKNKFEVIEGPPQLQITQAEGENSDSPPSLHGSKEKNSRRKSGSDRNGDGAKSPLMSPREGKSPQRSPRESTEKSPRRSSSKRQDDEGSSKPRRSSFKETISTAISPRGDGSKSPRGDSSKSPRDSQKTNLQPKSPRGESGSKSPRGEAPKSPRESKNPVAKIQKVLAEEDFVSLSESDGDCRR